MSPKTTCFLACAALLLLAPAGQAQDPQAGKQNIEVPAPPFSPDIFPCSQCHDPKTLPPNPQRRKLEAMHDDIVLKHDEQHRWCLDCHDLQDRDHLHSASGEKIEFTESYKLCGQCHGTMLRDWRAGVHGKRTGYWNGRKQYLLCVQCHNPHQPVFTPLAPKPPPLPPNAIKAGKQP
jgi:hypothetical protein